MQYTHVCTERVCKCTRTVQMHVHSPGKLGRSVRVGKLRHKGAAHVIDALLIQSAYTSIQHLLKRIKPRNKSHRHELASHYGSRGGGVRAVGGTGGEGC